MTEDANPDADWTPLFEGYTAEGLLRQCQLWQEWMQGTYFSSPASRRIPFEDDPDRRSGT